VTALSEIIAASAAGDLTPAEAANLCKIIDTYLRTLEATSVDERLTELERAKAEAKAAPHYRLRQSTDVPVFCPVVYRDAQNRATSSCVSHQRACGGPPVFFPVVYRRRVLSRVTPA